MHGGGHEGGMRSGTLPAHQIVGMGEAFAVAKQKMQTDYIHLLNLRARLMQQISELSFVVQGDGIASFPGILNMYFENIEPDIFLNRFPHIAFSTGSACQSKDQGGSKVLRALGLSAEQAKNSMRVSFGRG